MGLDRSDLLHVPPPLLDTLLDKGIDAVAAAVAAGANINARDKHGATLLYHLCAMRPHTPEDRRTYFTFIRTLLALGASANTQTHFGLTPFYILCEQTGDKEVFDLLETMLTRYGADINIRGKSGKTALHCAVVEKHKPMFDFLLAHKATNPTLSDANLETPLHAAAKQGNLSFLNALIARGADLDARDKLGNTPLHIACGSGETAAAAALLAAGAQRDIKNANGFTPYTYQFSAVNALSLANRSREFTKHFLLPALLASLDLSHPLLSAQAHDNEKLRKRYDEWIRQLSDTVAHSLCPEPFDNGRRKPSALFIQDYLRPMRIAHTWWRHTVALPSSLLPFRNNRKWWPYMQDDFIASNGYRVHCLTRSGHLAEMSYALRLCVGRQDYDSRCCNGLSHIFSISTPEGKPVSVVELGYRTSPAQQEDEADTATATTYTHAKPAGNYIELQHEGYDNSAPSHLAKNALEEFLRARDRGTVTLYEAMGETLESKIRYYSRPFLHREIGFVPSKESVEAVYDEYRLNYRRATLGKFNDRALVYDDVPGEDKYIHRNHFIRGYVLVDGEGKPVGKHVLTSTELHPMPGERILDLRRLDAMSYLRATGLLEKARIYTRLHMPELAAQLEGVWKEQERLPLTERPMLLPKSKIQRKQREYHDRIGAQDTREQVASVRFARY